MRYVFCLLFLVSSIAIGPVMGGVFNVDPDAYVLVWMGFISLSSILCYTVAVL